MLASSKFEYVVFDVNSNASGLFAVPSTAGLKGSAYANVGAGPSNFVVAEADDGHTFFDKQFMAGDPRNTAGLTLATGLLQSLPSGRVGVSPNRGAGAARAAANSKADRTRW